MLLETLAGDLGCFPLDYEAYPTQSDSRILSYGICGLNGVGKSHDPLAQSEPYLRNCPYEASPKAISGRTSYRLV